VFLSYNQLYSTFKMSGSAELENGIPEDKEANNPPSPKPDNGTPPTAIKTG